MENTKTLNALDEFAKAKPNEIPRELDEYLGFVANTGDPVYQWSLVKILFRQKLLNVIMEFFETCPMGDVPLSPNLDAFNFEIVKKRLLERYDTFSGVPFTIQRIAELLTAPKKQYSRLDKYMRALEKNIWVVSTREAICRDIAAEQNTLVNGALPNVLHSNNVNATPERLKRQPEAFDSEEDDEDPTDHDPNHSAPDGQYTYEPQTEQVSDFPADTNQIEVSVATDQTDSVPSPSQPQENADAAQNLLTESDSCTSSEVVEEEEEEQEDTIGQPASSASLEEEIVSVVESEPDESPKVEITIPEVTEEKEKTEDVTVTEITQESDSDSPIEEIVETPLIVEPLSSEVSAVSDDDKPERADLKRKIEEVIGEEEAVPSKKIECEAPESATIEACVSVEEPSVAAELIQEATQIDKETETALPPVVEETMDNAAQLAESIIGPVQIEECLAQSEREMESTPFEEKAEMVVEEPDLSMDVDETSVQSPMVQEDVAEPMEATDQGSL